MPQLNPSPWFAIMLFSWLVFLVVIPPKVMNHVFPNDLDARTASTFDNDVWTWPWL